MKPFMYLLSVFLYAAFLAGVLPLTVTAQNCTTTITNGQNIAVNSDFSAGNSGFTYSTGGGGYNYFTCGSPLPNGGCYSGPGSIYVGSHSDWFNQNFNQGSNGFGNSITDHSPGSDNTFLMVDGTCTAGNDAWAQVLPVQQNTWYYFEAWVTNIYVNAAGGGNANLNLNINNIPVLTFSPPATTQGNWVHYSFTWFSAGNTTADLAIQNTTTTNCGSGVDFGLDDITFTPGCDYANAATPQPALGPDQPGCSSMLDSHVPAIGGRTFTWIQGNPGTVIPGATGSTYMAATAGTYGVCIQDAGGCIKSDVIQLTCPMPVTFLNFTVRAAENHIQVNWSTGTEKNSLYFSIEQSVDGIQFISAGTVAAAGNSATIKNYSFTDQVLSTGIYYYKIIEYDTDGQRTESQVLATHSETVYSASIIPNPNNGNFTVLLENNSEEPKRLILYNTVGSILYSDLNTNSSAIQIHTEGLAVGVYFLSIQTGTHLQIKKILIQ